MRNAEFPIYTESEAAAWRAGYAAALARRLNSFIHNDQLVKGDDDEER